ncbi:unnamed protein product [Linum trigynum]|uniref:Uncharacterized protein n=1 Tax=Linum trigynum TaxID=586398 RepID=A0AAV2CW85_9ROSI
MEFAVIATVLVAFFVAYLAFLFVQFVYVVIRRKALVHRRTSPDDVPLPLPLPAAKSPATAAAAGSISPTQIKHFLRSAWKNKTSSLSSKALKAAEAAAAATTANPPSPPSAVVVQAAPPPTDEEVEEMLMGSRMRGPPRFLFTIKEEDREGSAADSGSFEDNCGGGSSSVRINKEFTGHAPYYGDHHCNSDEEVSSPVIGVVVELNQLTAPFGTAPCSRLHAAEEADGGSGGVVLPRILLAP